MSAKPTQRFPSLNAVRAFEAVGRLLSYKSAADELQVTTSAISHQIASLEEFFGIALIQKGRTIALTPAGERYFRQVSQGLTQLSLATTSLLQAKDRKVLRVTMAPTLATWWLAPRLERFVSRFPEMALDIRANTSPTDFSLGEFDLAIRYSKRIPTGLNAIPLGKNQAFPVCSPRLLKGVKPLREPGDLQAHTLISTRDVVSVDEEIGNWPGWLRNTNNTGITGARHIHLSPRGFMLRAVIEGLGVGIGRSLLVADAIRNRQLVCPFGPAFTLAGNYYLICPEIVARDPDIVTFRNWILEEAEASVESIRVR
jgi:LysR family glycine cleavage system transcriptional activator